MLHLHDLRLAVLLLLLGRCFEDDLALAHAGGEGMIVDILKDPDARLRHHAVIFLQVTELAPLVFGHADPVSAYRLQCAATCICVMLLSFSGSALEAADQCFVGIIILLSWQQIRCIGNAKNSWSQSFDANFQKLPHARHSSLEGVQAGPRIETTPWKLAARSTAAAPTGSAAG